MGLGPTRERAFANPRTETRSEEGARLLQERLQAIPRAGETAISSITDLLDAYALANTVDLAGERVKMKEKLATALREGKVVSGAKAFMSAPSPFDLFLSPEEQQVQSLIPKPLRLLGIDEALLEQMRVGTVEGLKEKVRQFPAFRDVGALQAREKLAVPSPSEVAAGGLTPTPIEGGALTARELVSQYFNQPQPSLPEIEPFDPVAAKADIAAALGDRATAGDFKTEMDALIQAIEDRPLPLPGRGEKLASILGGAGLAASRALRGQEEGSVARVLGAAGGVAGMRSGEMAKEERILRATRDKEISDLNIQGLKAFHEISMAEDRVALAEYSAMLNAKAAHTAEQSLQVRLAQLDAAKASGVLDQALKKEQLIRALEPERDMKRVIGDRVTNARAVPGEAPQMAMSFAHGVMFDGVDPALRDQSRAALLKQKPHPALGNVEGHESVASQMERAMQMGGAAQKNAQDQFEIWQQDALMQWAVRNPAHVRGIMNADKEKHFRTLVPGALGQPRSLVEGVKVGNPGGQDPEVHPGPGGLNPGDLFGPPVLGR